MAPQGKSLSCPPVIDLVLGHAGKEFSQDVGNVEAIVLKHLGVLVFFILQVVGQAVFVHPLGQGSQAGRGDVAAGTG